MISEFQRLVDRYAPKRYELPVYFEIVAKGDGESLGDHEVMMGPGQKSSMRRLIAGLSDWKKRNP